MKTITVFLIITTFFIGCTSATKINKIPEYNYPTKIYTSNGKEGFIITCSGPKLNWGDCYQKAGEICGQKGYKILDAKEEQKGLLQLGNPYMNYNNRTYRDRYCPTIRYQLPSIAVPLLYRTMVIICNEKKIIESPKKIIENKEDRATEKNYFKDPIPSSD